MKPQINRHNNGFETQEPKKIKNVPDFMSSRLNNVICENSLSLCETLWFHISPSFRVLLKYNHREHRENIIFHEVGRNFITSPLCFLYCYPPYPHSFLAPAPGN
jgi:hypothetical protein